MIVSHDNRVEVIFNPTPDQQREALRSGASVITTNSREALRRNVEAELRNAARRAQARHVRRHAHMRR
jgi:hypothetical protein